MTTAPLPRDWTSIATRTMSGRHEWQMLPRSPLTLEQIEIGVAAGLILRRTVSYGDGKLCGMQVKPR